MDQRFARGGRVFLVAGIGAVVLLVSGCGSSGSSAEPWAVVSTEHNASANFGLVKGDVGQPSQVEVTVVTKPSVKATTHYTIACGPANYDNAKNRFGPTGMTPLTFRVAVPRPENGPASCLVVAGSDYTSKVDTTITLLQRDVPTTTTGS